MFTGLIVERGRIARPPAASGQGGLRLDIAHSPALAERLEIGASLAVSGVCLTVTALSPEASGKTVVSTVELAPETLRRTALGDLAAGDAVNLEPALRMGDPLGGHWVQGHVDGLASLVRREDLDRHRELTFALAPDLGRYVVEKGSIALDGVSLTVAGAPREAQTAGGEPVVELTVALIPHTLDATTLGALASGSRVHVEIDVLAKYVERLLGPRAAAGGDDG